MNKLAIVIITMNRAEQLKNAIISCLECELDEQTQFVVIDNASTDNTEQVVKEVLGDSSYVYYYEKLLTNKGVGGGRNYGFSKANSKYSYFLDDDAIIDYQNDRLFFKRALDILEKHDNIVSLTTQIYDTAWGKNRNKIAGKRIDEDLYSCKAFCGGSHFLRNSFFGNSPYLPNKYGFEELLPSLKAINERKINAYCPNLLVFHCPQVNKWDYTVAQNEDIVINECAIPYAIKSMMYPNITCLMLKMAYLMRCKKYLSNIYNGKKRADQAVLDTKKTYCINYKVSLQRFVFMLLEFGLSIF